MKLINFADAPIIILPYNLYTDRKVIS